MYTATIKYEGMDNLTHTETLHFASVKDLSDQVLFLQERGACSVRLEDTDWEGNVELLEAEAL